ncbi:DUF1697 domain-containing protein [Kallotenue papyrolyticum]|uniref:DUF1697 domain-containing protein n=1 Tax=Kallotenue papyrolyticum TaxID=1325125 RepID=UPI00046F4BBE|nr:DUF1697 domain-containing protein [Kallotenue papyrolyticum]
MNDTLHLALLRGINVGGNNIIRMADLKAAFEALGFGAVQTYIQSGNVLFRSAGDIATLEASIEEWLSQRFGYTSRVVVITHACLAQIVAQAPPDFGSDPSQYHYDVVFLKHLLTVAQGLRAVETRPGVDAAYSGAHALYFRRLIARATQSRFPKLASKPEYQYMTIRNWNTTTRLLALMDAQPV